ncbi:MAG: ATP phosphoribosyltransferase, partial [Varibaculum cambriense]|nr:ATP phosphoribosyltransferase [Varibaculum cambriense]
MLRIAVPNKGGLSDPAIRLLSEAGYRTRRRGRELHITDQSNQVEIFFLRPRDIAQYVGAGFIQAGITGRDLLADSGVKAEEVLALGFGSSTFRFAAPQGTMSSVQDLKGKRIATTFDRIVQDYLASQQVKADAVHLDG